MRGRALQCPSDANAWTQKADGKEFDRLTPARRNEVLRTMDAGRADFTKAKMFFEQFYTLAYWSARTIVQDYVKRPGPLVPA